MIFAAIVFLTFISLKDLSTLIKKSRWKEITVYAFLTILNLTMAFFVLLDMQLPNPQDFINWIGDNLFGSR